MPARPISITASLERVKLRVSDRLESKLRPFARLILYRLYDARVCKVRGLFAIFSDV